MNILSNIFMKIIFFFKIYYLPTNTIFSVMLAKTQHFLI